MPDPVPDPVTAPTRAEATTPPGDRLAALIAAVRPPDDTSSEAARARHDRLLKPPGSLGRLEAVGARLAGIAGACPPPVPARPVVAVFAADHGVHARGVSPWPQEVTAQMVSGFLAGQAAITVLADEVGAAVRVVDIGLAHEPALPEGAADRLIRRRIRPGTADFSTGSAMSTDEAVRAVLAGAAVAEELITAGHDLIITGDMGIANTTAAAAVISVFTGRSASEVTGRGTGIDDATLEHKTAVIEGALARLRPDAADPTTVLAAVGGLEHAGLAGMLIMAATRGVPVLLDGVNAGAAALVAAAYAPAAVGSWIAGHRSAEPGATAALIALGLTPLLDLDLRLGEGTGACLAVPLVRAAARVLHEMATFDDAGVAGPG